MKKLRFVSLLLALVVSLVLVTTAAADTTYVVQWGDTLASIARRYDTTITAIAQANSILNPNLIYAGQTLIIPTGEGHRRHPRRRRRPDRARRTRCSPATRCIALRCALG